MKYISSKFVIYLQFSVFCSFLFSSMYVLTVLTKIEMVNKWIVSSWRKIKIIISSINYAKHVLLLNFFNGSSLLITTLRRTWLYANRLIVLHRTTYLRYLGFFKALVLHGFTQSSQSTFFLVQKISIQDFTNAMVISQQEQTRVLLIW